MLFGKIDVPGKVDDLVSANFESAVVSSRRLAQLSRGLSTAMSALGVETLPRGRAARDCIKDAACLIPGKTLADTVIGR